MNPLLKRPLLLFLFFNFCSTVYAIEAELVGLDDDKLADNITAHLSQLDTPSQCRLSEDSVITIEDRIAKASQALGYYQLTVDDIVFSDLQDCDELRITISQGTQVTITELTVEVTGEGRSESNFVDYLSALPLKINTPLVHANYNKVKSQLDSIALNKGYFDSAFTTNQIRVDEAANTAAIILTYESGVRYAFGDIIYPDDLFAKELIKTIIPFSQQQPYEAKLLGKFNRNLSQTGYFQQVVARPLLDNAQGKDIPIEIIATARPRDIFNLGGGVSTDKGLTGKLNWQRPWVNRHGHSMKGDLYVSAPEQSASLHYKIPIEDPLHNYLAIQTGYNAIDNNDSNSDTLSLAIQRHWTNTTQDWNKIAFLRYSRDRFQQGTEPQTTTNLLIPGFTLSRHRSRGGLDVTWGDSQLLTIEGASDAIVSDINLARITFQTKWLRSFGEHRFLIRGEFGALNTNDFSQVPNSLRYFAGGDQSVRGFGYEELAPREPDIGEQRGKLIGGQYLNVGSIEYTYPVAADWRAALFTDVGGASEKPFEELAYSIGIGASWMSPVGPIRLYLAKGFGDFGDDIRIHFAMGPAL